MAEAAFVDTRGMGIANKFRNYLHDVHNESKTIAVTVPWCELTKDGIAKLVRSSCAPPAPNTVGPCGVCEKPTFFLAKTQAFLDAERAYDLANFNYKAAVSLHKHWSEKVKRVPELPELIKAAKVTLLVRQSRYRTVYADAPGRKRSSAVDAARASVTAAKRHIEALEKEATEVDEARFAEKLATAASDLQPKYQARYFAEDAYLAAKDAYNNARAEYAQAHWTCHAGLANSDGNDVLTVCLACVETRTDELIAKLGGPNAELRVWRVQRGSFDAVEAFLEGERQYADERKLKDQLAVLEEQRAVAERLDAERVKEEDVTGEDDSSEDDEPLAARRKRARRS